MNALATLIPIILIAWVDIIVKRIYVQIYLKKEYQKWADLPNFWKDHIDNDYWWRLRWVYTLNFGLGLPITYMLTDWQTTLITLILMGGLAEHIIFEWTATLLFGDYKSEWLWLHPFPAWLRAYPVIRWVAAARGRLTVITSGDVVVLGVTGAVLAGIVGYVI
jgi:hypothetical protein